MGDEEGPVIWIVDSDHWPRSYLRAELIERGYQAVGFEDLRDVLVELALGRPRPALLIVVVHDQPIPPHQRAALARGSLHLLWVVGSTATVPEAPLDSSAMVVLRRPVTIGRIADTVERAVAPAARR